MAQTRAGLMFGIAANVLWGTLALYWPLLEPGGAVEILAHRMVWSVLAMTLLVLIARRYSRLRELLRDRRRVALLSLAAVVIAFNWGIYIYGVNNDLVVEASLGYFINPLMTVAIGVLVFGERMRAVQWGAAGVAAAAVVILAFEAARPPWIGIGVALTFTVYGLLKKTAGAGALESLTLETALIAPIALAYLLWLGATGEGHFGTSGSAHALFTALSGFVTAAPLICFGAAATRISMTTLGLLAYIAPVLTFAVGVFVRGEPMSSIRWAGFAVLWVALVIFTVESLAHHRRSLALAAEASAA